MSTADDDEKTLSGPPTPASARAVVRDDAESGLQAERRRGRAAEPQPGHTLPLATRLRDYEITSLIGEGGFGIVYLAWDHSLQRKVAIKEYMPASMAARVNGSSAIVVKSERHLRHVPRRPEELRQRGAPARPLRPPVAGQGLPLLGRERHRLHGDAVLRGADAEGSARRPRPRAERGRAARLADAAARRARRHARQRSATTATSRPTTSCSRRAARSCSTSARRDASSAT